MTATRGYLLYRRGGDSLSMALLRQDIARPQQQRRLCHISTRSFLWRSCGTSTAGSTHWCRLHKTRQIHTETIDKKSLVVYEGPFASLTLRLKRVSITSAIVSLVGIPLLVGMQSNGGIPMTGQLAVGGTALLAATGSTLAMSFCFSPYVHTLEQVPIRKCHYKHDDNIDDNNDTNNKECLVKATTRNVLGMQVETVFDPKCDLKKPAPNSIRPFCNVMAKDTPLYIHSQLVTTEPLRTYFLSVMEETKQEPQDESKNQDDDFF